MPEGVRRVRLVDVRRAPVTAPTISSQAPKPPNALVDAYNRMVKGRWYAWVVVAGLVIALGVPILGYLAVLWGDLTGAHIPDVCFGEWCWYADGRPEDVDGIPIIGDLP